MQIHWTYDANLLNKFSKIMVDLFV